MGLGKYSVQIGILMCVCAALATDLLGFNWTSIIIGVAGILVFANGAANIATYGEQR